MANKDPCKYQGEQISWQIKNQANIQGEQIKPQI